jgi:hypothetical protein
MTRRAASVFGGANSGRELAAGLRWVVAGPVRELPVDDHVRAGAEVDAVAGQAGCLRPAQPAPGGQQHHRPVARIDAVGEGEDLGRGQRLDNGQHSGGQFNAVAGGAGQQPVIDRVRHTAPPGNSGHAGWRPGDSQYRAVAEACP